MNARTRSRLAASWLWLRVLIMLIVAVFIGGVLGHALRPATPAVVLCDVTSPPLHVSCAEAHVTAPR